MRVLVLTHNPRHQSNPYVGTLMDEVERLAPDVTIEYGYRHFWSDAAYGYDIIHNMWPDVLRRGGRLLVDIEQRLAELHRRGVHIVSTCHNLVAHVAKEDDAYDVLYRHSDAIFHLGAYSHELMCKQYPQAAHVLGFHHVYDTLYPLDAVHTVLDGTRPVRVVCIGDFRKDAERLLVAQAAQDVPEAEFYCPSFCRSWWENVKNRWQHTLPRNLHASHGKLSDKALVNLCRKADVLLVQRLSTLNSGNVTLGFIFALVVAGPDVGNISGVLKSAGCPTFIPTNPASVAHAVRQAAALASQGHGRTVQQQALSQYSTRAAAQLMLECYRTIK